MRKRSADDGARARRAVFVDTSALIALADRSDDHHRAAAAFVRRLPPGSRLITTDYVLDEAITFLRFRIGHAPTVQFVEGIGASRLFQVIAASSAVREAAWALFRAHGDKEFSFTDCVSFAFMKAAGVEEAFGFDRDFLRAGFTLVPLKE